MNSRLPSSGVAGLILAAGESRRMGFPKALLPFHGKTFLETLTARFTPVCSTVIVVLGAHADEIRAAASGLPVNFVPNPRWKNGQTGSMQAGLRAVPPDARGVLFTLVDHPAVTGATLDKLVSAGGRALLRVPRYHGKRGHPIWFASSLIPEFLALDENLPARDIVRAHAPETEFLDLDDAGIAADVDNPEEYRRLMESVR